MNTVHRFRIATVLTVTGLAITVFWLIELYPVLTHTGPPPAVGGQHAGFILLWSAVVATLACAGACGLTVPMLIRDPALRTPTRIASSIGAALTALLLLVFWARAFARTQGVLSVLNFVLFVGLAPGIPVLLIARAVRRFRAESSKRWPIVVLAIALLVLWAVASYVALTANYLALSMGPATQTRVSYLATLTYAAFGSGLVMAMRRPRALVVRALLIVAGVVFLAMVLFWVLA